MFIQTDEWLSEAPDSIECGSRKLKELHTKKPYFHGLYAVKLNLFTYNKFCSVKLADSLRYADPNGELNWNILGTYILAFIHFQKITWQAYTILSTIYNEKDYQFKFQKLSRKYNGLLLSNSHWSDWIHICTPLRGFKMQCLEQ